MHSPISSLSSLGQGTASRLSIAGHPSTRTKGRKCSSVRTAAIPEWLRKTFDFQSWAPKSARVWRLQEYEVPDSPDEPEKPNEVDESIDELQARASEMSKQEKDKKDTYPAYASSSSSIDAFSSEEQTQEAEKSFSEADDGELAKALRARMQSISSSSSEEEEEEQPNTVSADQSLLQDGGASFAGEEADEEDDDEVDPLSGDEMRELIWSKYGKAYDVSFARRDVPGKAFVCLNIMWQHLEQRSFKMTKAQYIDKVDSVAYMVNVLGQTERVREFLSSTARSERGLPRRPVVGTAISIQLDLPPDVVQDFFGSGYY